MRLAIHQPYYIPYAGYFRMFAAADLVVMYDDAQFVKGGWIHRNVLKGKWKTLPIVRPRLGTLIKDLEWQPEVKTQLKPCPYIIDSLLSVCWTLSIPFNVIRSSDLNIPAHLKGQERILAICELLKADTYINASGGTGLYDAKEFKKRDIKLEFFTEYKDKTSIIERVANENSWDIMKDIYDNCLFQ